MPPALRRPTVAVGVVLVAVLALLDVASPWVFPAPPSAPAFADALTLALGLIALAGLGTWLATAARAAMAVVVVVRVIGGLFSVMAFLDPTLSAGFVAANGVYLAVTVLALVLVAPTLRRTAARSSGAARAAG
jgi:hypothetical protein